MQKRKFPPLDHQEKQELIEYWEKTRKSYNELVKYFEKKWAKKVSISVVSDVIYQWKKNKYVRGRSKIEQFEIMWKQRLSAVNHLLEQTNTIISPNCIYSILLGELYDQDLTLSSLSRKALINCCSGNYMVLPDFQHRVHPMDLSVVNEICRNYPLSRIFFIDSFQLFHKCPPFWSHCYNIEKQAKLNPRERVDVYVWFSADGQIRGIPLVCNHHFINRPASGTNKRGRRSSGMDQNHLLTILQELNEEVERRFPGETALVVMEDLYRITQDGFKQLLATSVSSSATSSSSLADTSEPVSHTSSATDPPTITKGTQPLLFASLRILPLPPHQYLPMSPFSSTLLPVIRISYKGKLVQSITAKVQNRRGYKRLLSNDECAQLMNQVWEEMPAEVLAMAVMESPFYGEYGRYDGQGQDKNNDKHGKESASVNSAKSLTAVNQEDTRTKVDQNDQNDDQLDEGIIHTFNPSTSISILSSSCSLPTATSTTTLTSISPTSTSNSSSLSLTQYHTAVQQSLRDTLELYKTTFSIKQSEWVDVEYYSQLELVPYLAGIGVIRDYLRCPEIQPILFNNPAFPEAPFFPPFHHQSSFAQGEKALSFSLSEQNGVVYESGKEDLMETSSMNTSPERSFEGNPNDFEKELPREVASAFIHCLENMIQEYDELKGKEEPYLELIQKIQQFYGLTTDH